MEDREEQERLREIAREAVIEIQHSLGWALSAAVGSAEDHVNDVRAARDELVKAITLLTEFEVQVASSGAFYKKAR